MLRSLTSLSQRIPHVPLFFSVVALTMPESVIPANDIPAGYTRYICMECGLLFVLPLDIDPDCPFCPYMDYSSDCESDASTVNVVDLTSQSQDSE